MKSLSRKDVTALLVKISMEEKDLDGVVDELMVMLETMDTPFRANPSQLREFVAEFIVDRYAERWHWLSPAMNKDLLDLGLLERTYPDWNTPPSRPSTDLTRVETRLVGALNGHLSRSQSSELTKAIGNRRLMVNERVIASLTWHGLAQLRALIEKAIHAKLGEAKHEPAIEAEFEALQDPAPFFPTDEDDWMLDTLDTKHQETGQWLLALVNFNAQVQTPTPGARKFKR